MYCQYFVKWNYLMNIDVSTSSLVSQAAMSCPVQSIYSHQDFLGQPGAHFTPVAPLKCTIKALRKAAALEEPSSDRPPGDGIKLINRSGL